MGDQECSRAQISTRARASYNHTCNTLDSPPTHPPTTTRRQGGELFDAIVERKNYSERDAAELIRTIVSVVAHCHNMGVMHRDLKPENFLLESKAPDAAILCTDFGLSAFFKPGQQFSEARA